METLILTQAQVRELLTMDACIDVVANGLCALARGEGQNPLRSGMLLEDGRGLLGLMPGFLGGEQEALGLKVIALMPGNHGTEWDAHQGLVALFDPKIGVPRAIMDAAEVTAIPPAAASGVATRAQAREDATKLALVGAGVQGRTHIEAMRSVRPIDAVRVYARKRDRLEAFCERMSAAHGIPVEPAESAQSAVEWADIVCTTTSSSQPVVLGEWLRPGMHINAVGACTFDTRELDSAAVARCRVFVERTESSMNESGDLLIARAEGAIEEPLFESELGPILLGQAAGRESEEEITLFDSLGIAAHDLVSAQYVDERARELGVGTLIAIGGRA